MEANDYKGRHVVITGGGGEIGLVMAAEFVRRGAVVTLLDKVLPGHARQGVEQLGCRFEALDVTDAAAVEAVLARIPLVDVAVANAGIHRGARFLELSREDWQVMQDVNVTGVFLFCQAAARRMVEAGRGGAILVTGSWVQDVPHVDNTGYCTSKAGVAMLARCMALELGEHDIRVNIVAPGIVDAGMAKRQLEIDPVFKATALKGIPLGRLQTAEQVAKTAAFVCSSDAESITGATLLVDGGLSLFKR